jgi:hypothetical protein
MADAIRYLAIVQLHPSSDLKRVGRDVPGLVDMLKQLSTGRHEHVFRSNDGQLFGYLVETRKATHHIRVEFDSSTHTIHGDSIFLVEVGYKAAEIGFNRPYSWLFKDPASATARDAPKWRP